MEKVLVLTRSLEIRGGDPGLTPGPVVAAQIVRYASLLASQGHLAAAMSYLPRTPSQPLTEQLRDRLRHAQGEKVAKESPSPVTHSPAHAGALQPQVPANHRSPHRPSLGPPCLHQRCLCPVRPQLRSFSPTEEHPRLTPRTALELHPLPLPDRLPVVGRAATWGLPAMLFSPLPLGCPAGMSDPPRGPGAPSSKPPAACSLPPPPTAQESWDSPSAPRGSLPRKKVPERFTPPTPITTPIMNLPAGPPGGSPVRFPPSQAFVHRLPGMPAEGGTLVHQLPVVQIKESEIPSEHQGLKTTFESLLQRCLSVATDIKTKRKLEGASQRLECLYEKLREQALSQPILLGLHELAHCAEAGHYPQALAVHTQVVSSSSFSDVSGFMPILKALLTTAQKLNV
ncbi:UNVERIFIED_CONTAM: hypothetical protein K2H54_007425 [Gekko kuhli]